MECPAGSVNTQEASNIVAPQLTPAEQFGRRLRQLRREKSAREERDVEQGEVAKAVQDTQPNVARWERGRIPKDTATVKKLADFYGVQWIWLLHGEGEAYPPLPKEQDTEPRPATRAGGARAVGGRSPRGR